MAGGTVKLSLRRSFSPNSNNMKSTTNKSNCRARRAAAASNGPGDCDRGPRGGADRQNANSSDCLVNSNAISINNSRSTFRVGCGVSNSRSRTSHRVVAKLNGQSTQLKTVHWSPDIDGGQQEYQNGEFIMEDRVQDGGNRVPNQRRPRGAHTWKRPTGSYINPRQHHETGANMTRSASQLIRGKRPLYVGCWNINTLSDKNPARGDMLADDLVKHRMDVVGLSEVRIPGTGTKTILSSSGQTFTVHYSGHQKNRINGVGLALSAYAQKSLVSVNTINDRIMSARFSQSKQFVTVVACYAPTEATEAAVKDAFYTKLTEVVDAVPKTEFLFVVGDMNAGVGKNRSGWERILGPHTASGPRNTNGHRLLRFSSDQNLRLLNTFFEHKHSHLVTWTSNTGTCEKTLDYILIRARHFPWAQNVRVFRRTALPTDHHLLVAAIKLKLTKVKAPPKAKKFDVKLLRDVAVATKFKARTQELLDDFRQEEDTEIPVIWEKLKSALLKSGKEIVGFAKPRKKDRFASARTNNLIEELQKTTIKRDRRRLAQKIRRSSKRDEEAFWSKQAEILHQAFSVGDSKTLFGTISSLIGKSGVITETLYDGNGVLLSDKDSCLNQWTGHFDSQMNKPNPTATDPNLTILANAAIPDPRISTAPPSEDEVKKVLKGLKDGKAAGLDSLPGEFFKEASTEIAPWLTKLLGKIWECGKAPGDWQECALIPVYKKGDRKKCGNYRGIAILPVVCKITSIIVLNRLVKVLDEKMPETQAGFRHGRGTIEQILFLRQVLERRYEHKKETIVAFLDFSSAFDSIDRKALWDLLRIAGVPDLFVGLIRSMYEQTLCKIKAYGKLGKPFKVGTGVRQGDVMSPLLFLLAIEYVIRMALRETDGVQFAENLKTSSAEYADDVALLSDSVEKLQDHINRFQAAAEVVGLSLNGAKCKAIAHPPQNIKLEVNDEQIDYVSGFTYLGSQICANTDPGPEVEARIGRATGAFRALHGRLWGRKQISTRVKLRFYEASVLSVLCYGLHTIAIRRGDLEKLEIFHRRNLRVLLGFHLTDRIRNEEIHRRAKVPPIAKILKKHRLGLVGHVARRNEDRPARQAVFEEPPRDWRGAAGIRKTWRRTVDEDLEILMSGSYNKYRYSNGFCWRRIIADIAADRHQWSIVCSEEMRGNDSGQTPS